MQMRAIVVMGIPLSLAASALGAQDATLAGLDQQIETAIARWEVPALAIAIVKDGRVVYAKGFGVLTTGRPERATAETIFGAGSTTKAFTAAALAMLVDEGKLRWDDRVIDHLKWFRLYDPYATANITIRDLLSHMSGVPAGDRMWYNHQFDRAEVVRRVRYQQPTLSFRQQYGYSNTMYTAAGLVVEAVTGKTWDAFIRERIFAPLGMRRSTTSIVGLEAMGNVATLHSARVTGKAVPFPRWNQDNIGPAGSINSTVVDMAQWVRLQLGRGRYEGRTLVSPARVAEMHSSQSVVRGGGGGEDAALFSAYGFGWQLRDYHGRKLVSHGGGGHGVAAEVALVPDENLGIVILTNADGPSLSSALKFDVLDRLLGLPAQNRTERNLASRDSALARSARVERQLDSARARGTRPTLPLDAYVGTYWHPYYDSAKVVREGDHLRFRFVNEIDGPLEHWQYDTFRGHWTHPRYGTNFISFLIGADARVSAVRVPVEWDTTLVVDYVKVAPRR